MAVDKFSLVIEDGSFTTLLGPSGCGKTTTLRMIAGLATPTSGEILIGDTCVYSAEKGAYIPPAKRQLGLVFQSYALWPHLTVFENIAFGLRIAKKSSKDIQEQVDRISSILYINDLLKRFPSELSGGQQQRVAIARVLVMNPKVLLLDEPLSNLDAKLRMDMRAELKRLHQETKSTIVYVTHDQLEALTMSTHVAVMHLGKLQQFDGPMEVYHEPANTFTADFIGNPRINFLKGKITPIDNKGVNIEAGLIKMEIQTKHTFSEPVEIQLGIRSEDFLLSDEQRSGFEEGRIYSVLPAGSEWYIRISLGDDLLTAKVFKDYGFSIDDPVWISVEPSRIKCFDTDGQRIFL